MGRRRVALRRVVQLDDFDGLEETGRLLLQAAAAAVDDTRASSLHITFMTESEW